MFNLNRVGVAVGDTVGAPAVIVARVCDMMDASVALKFIVGVAVGVTRGALAVNVARACDMMDTSVAPKSTVGVTVGVVVGVLMGVAVAVEVGGSSVGGAMQDASGNARMKSPIKNASRILTAPLKKSEPRRAKRRIVSSSIELF
ncbi:MAG: hypothetical protein HZB51_04445 [Chloroflexi bacterium]|nr:hypothetical protein [Chloroflexota bacterium]